MNLRRRLAAPLLFTLLVAWLPDAAAQGRSHDRRARSPAKSARRASARPPLRRVVTPVRRQFDTTTPEGRLRQDLESIWAGRILRRGTTAIYVVDARTGQDIYAIHPDDKVNPASNVKLLSTATVLDLM